MDPRDDFEEFERVYERAMRASLLQDKRYQDNPEKLESRMAHLLRLRKKAQEAKN